MPRVCSTTIFVSHLAFTLICGLTACASYQPAPLELTSPLKNTFAVPDHNRSGTGSMPAGPLTVRDIAARALLNNPDLQAARAQHGIAQAEVFNAGLLPDPIFSAGFQALTGGPGSIPSIAGSLTQDLSAVITYRVDQRAAHAGAARVDAEILWQEWQTSAQAVGLCIAIDGDTRILKGLQADQQALTRLNTHTTAQVEAGNLTIGAASASLAALAATQTAFNAETQTLAQDRNRLDALLGLQPGIALHVVPPEIGPLPQQVIDAAIASLATRRPDLIALRYGYEQADARLRGAILSQFLPISLSANGGRDTSNVQSFGPGVSLTLPLFNRNRGNIAVARATRTQLSAQFSASLATASGDAQALTLQIRILEGQSAVADRNAAAADKIAANSARAAANGAIDGLTEVNLQTAAAERTREAQLLRTQLLTARLSLITLLGIGLPTQAVTNPDDVAS